MKPRSPMRVPNAKMKSVSLTKPSFPAARPGIAMTFEARLDNGREKWGPVPPDFDVWASTEEQVHKWMEEGVLQHGNPAYAQWAAASLITRQRRKIETNGPALLKAVSLVAKQGLVMPRWMADVYVTRFLRVERLEVGTLDEAFGPLPYKPGKKLDSMRLRRALIPKIGDLLVKTMNEDPHRAIDKSLFEEIGGQIGRSATFVEDAYREGVREHGMQDIKHLKDLKLFPFG